MSVINKMLRDLDHRRAPVGAAALSSMAEPAVGIRVVASGAGANRRGVWRAGWALAGLALVAAALIWWWSLAAPALPGQADMAAVAARGAAVASVAVPTAPGLPAASAPLAATPSGVAAAASAVGPPALDPLTMPRASFRMETILRTMPRERPVEDPAGSAAPTSASPASAVPGLGAVSVAKLKDPPKAASESSMSITPTQRQAAAAQLIEQAQRLWSAGSREAAITLLRDASSLAERDHGGAAQGAGGPLLTALVRELVRMELADGHVSQALERLTRLEHALAGEADLWALRGNAAQRLGRHHESANAYLAALKLRPDQARWMLGAAVSLAADGQIKAASTWAQSARERGALTPEVAAYLRQLGVNLAE
ncbi:hypothetical protein [Rhodoferax sp.]|uniref:hypothetical protein n=1 Tax=Rhodoferax sp. TaxID=50421 RepID=UPI002765A700|nr:hypothetical protein [Rhodoferax sp.]